MIIAAILFGPKVKNAVKSEPFECGMPPARPPKKFLHTNFYLTAILFVVFDIEIVFLYPWALEFRTLPDYAFYSMFIFIGVLGLALFYVIKRGALEWD